MTNPVFPQALAALKHYRQDQETKLAEALPIFLDAVAKGVVFRCGKGLLDTRISVNSVSNLSTVLDSDSQTKMMVLAAAHPELAGLRVTPAYNKELGHHLFVQVPQES